MPENPIKKTKESEIIANMIFEAQHEIVKCKVMERFFMLMALKGSSGKNKDAEYQYQAKRKAAEMSIPTLEGMYKDSLAKETEAEKPKEEPASVPMAAIPTETPEAVEKPKEKRKLKE